MTGTTAAPTGSFAKPTTTDSTGDTTAGEKVGELASDAKDKVAETTSKVRSQALDLADRRKGDIVEPARTVVEQTKRFVRELDESGSPVPTSLLRSATQELEQVATYVETTPVEEMLSDIGMRARRNPFTFLGAAFALGFLGSRLFKAESTPELPASTGSPYTGSYS
jgi:hypothetical protein